MVALLLAGTVVVAQSPGNAQPVPPAPAAGAGPAASAPAGRLGRELVISAMDLDEYLPSVAYNSKRKEYLVVWHATWPVNPRDIRGQRVSIRGELLGSPFVIWEDPEGLRDSAQPSVAYDPEYDRYLVVWSYDVSKRDIDWDIWGRFIPWNGPSATYQAFPISFSATTKEWNPVVALNRHGSWKEFLVVWTNDHETAYDYISGRRVKADGTGLIGTGPLILAQHVSENRVRPDLAYNLARNEYLLVYDNGQDILAKRLEANGNPLPPFTSEFTIAGWPDPETIPSVAACNTADQYLVAWQSFQGGGPDDDVYARFVTGAGVVEDVFPVYNTPAHERNPAVACNAAGRQYLVVWEQQYSNLSGPFGVWGRIIHTNKKLDPPFGITYVPNSQGTTPAVASNAASYFVAWQHLRGASSYLDIHGRVLAPYAAYLPLTVRKHD
jgi:hypothetical protein